MSWSLDVLPLFLCEKSFSKVGRPTNLCPFRYFSNLLPFGHQMAQPLGKPFDSQQTLGLKIFPNWRASDPGLNKLTIFFMCDSLPLPEMT